MEFQEQIVFGKFANFISRCSFVLRLLLSFFIAYDLLSLSLMMTESEREHEREKMKEGVEWLPFVMLLTLLKEKRLERDNCNQPFPVIKYPVV